MSHSDYVYSPWSEERRKAASERMRAFHAKRKADGTYRSPAGTTGFAWARATPRERADWVRSHAKIDGLTARNLCDLFELTPEGLTEILSGEDWRQEFSTEKVEAA